MDRKTQFLARLDGFLKLRFTNTSDIQNQETIASTLSLLLQIYGEDDSRFTDFKQVRLSYAAGKMGASHVARMTLPFAYGALASLKADIESGHIESMERVSTGGVITDFVVMARASIDQGQVSVSAVLSCAALEDALKRTAALAGLEVAELHMPEVINALVEKRVISGPQSKLVRSFVAIRNKVMHAQFDQVDSADVKAVLGFTEEFILKNLSS